MIYFEWTLENSRLSTAMTGAIIGCVVIAIGFMTIAAVIFRNKRKGLKEDMPKKLGT